MAREIEDGEKEVAETFVGQVLRDHQVLSSRDEDDEHDNKRKRGKICRVTRKGDNTKDGLTDLKQNYCYMTREGTLNIVEQVKVMIQSNNYSMHDCEPCLDKLTETCVDFKKALDKKNVATQELYHLRGRLEEKKLKVTMLEAYLKLEDDVGLLSETQLDIVFNQRDLA